MILDAKKLHLDIRIPIIANTPVLDHPILVGTLPREVDMKKILIGWR